MRLKAVSIPFPDCPYPPMPLGKTQKGFISPQPCCGPVSYRLGTVRVQFLPHLCWERCINGKVINVLWQSEGFITTHFFYFLLLVDYTPLVSNCDGRSEKQEDQISISYHVSHHVKQVIWKQNEQFHWDGQKLLRKFLASQTKDPNSHHYFGSHTLEFVTGTKIHGLAFPLIPGEDGPFDRAVRTKKHRRKHE